MKKEFSRYEVNQKIKMILVSHNVDLSTLTFSFSGKAAWFTGKLNKASGSPLGHEEVETLCKALGGLHAIRFLNFELEDWNVSASPGSFSISRKAVASSSSGREQAPLIIKTNEKIEDVLDDNNG